MTEYEKRVSEHPKAPFVMVRVKVPVPAPCLIRGTLRFFGSFAVTAAIFAALYGASCLAAYLATLPAGVLYAIFGGSWVGALGALVLRGRRRLTKN